MLTGITGISGTVLVGIGDHIEQLLDTVAPYRCNNPELGKMGPNRIDRSLLTDEQMARRWSIRPHCWSGVLVDTNRIFGR